MIKFLKSIGAAVTGWLDKILPPTIDPSDPTEGDMFADKADFD